MPRPPLYEKEMERKNVSLPPSLIKRAKEIGDGNLSRGLRKCVEAHEEEDD